MRGVAVRYPAFDDKLNRPVDLEQRVNLCRVDHQQLPPLADESRDLLALTALIGRQSQGMPIETGADYVCRHSSTKAAMPSCGVRGS